MFDQERGVKNLVTLYISGTRFPTLYFSKTPRGIVHDHDHEHEDHAHVHFHVHVHQPSPRIIFINMTMVEEIDMNMEVDDYYIA
jgi:hypothetical protein